MELNVSDLTVRGDAGETLVSVPSLHVPRGAAIGLRGPSGAGKSTLLYALAGLAGRTSGQVRWDDTQVLSLSRARRATFRDAHVGLVFQDFLLIEELSALENAAVSASYAPMAARPTIRARAARHLSALGLDPSSSRRVALFSGGERQRVAMSRALAHDPAIVLADEPTANLDRAAAETLAGDLVAAAHDGKTLIVVSHDEALLQRMHRVITVEHGKVRDA